MSRGLGQPGTCDAVREALPACCAGETEAEVLGIEPAALEAHLAACPGCAAERVAAQTVRRQLTAAAPLSAERGADPGAAGGLARLLAAAAAASQERSPDSAAAAAPPPTTTRVAAARPAWRPWLATAAAAALVAGTVWGVRALDLDRRAAPRPGPGPAVVAGVLTDTDGGALPRLPLDTPATAGPAGATVGLPARWTAALRARTRVTHTADGLVLEQGATLLHVVPGQGQLCVTTPHARVAVLGTVLLVDVQPTRTTVAVYDGRVQIDGRSGDGTLLTDGGVTLDAGRAVAVAADRAPALVAAAPALPDWLPASPAPTATLEAPEGPITAGTPTWLRFTLTNPGPGCCVLAAPNARDPHFVVTITPPGTDGGAAQELRRLAVRPETSSRAAVAGLVVLGPGESFTVSCEVGSSLTTAGRHVLVARYAAGTDAPAGTFVGTAASNPCPVNVRH